MNFYANCRPPNSCGNIKEKSVRPIGIRETKLWSRVSNWSKKYKTKKPAERGFFVASNLERLQIFIYVGKFSVKIIEIYFAQLIIDSCGGVLSASRDRSRRCQRNESRLTCLLTQPLQRPSRQHRCRNDDNDKNSI